MKNYSHLVIEPEFKGNFNWYLGTKRHHWVDSSITDRKVPDPNGHALLRNKEKK